MERFEYDVHYSLDASVERRTLRADFGDGYSQEAGDGINARKEAWRISAVGHWTNGTGMPVKAISEFIDRHGGYKAFEWETPMGHIKLFKCRAGYSLRHEGANVFELTATFEEVHHP